MDYMQQAISLAKLALGQVSPNPAVGAVIVKDGEIVGQGHTQPPGSWHAEVMAIKQAGEKARGGVMYVTLEPCSHYGRTPPCTKAIIDAGISEVHMAVIDPNPIVAGRGQAQLDAEGIKTFTGEHAEEARVIMEGYIKHITTGLPFVTVKFASSLDGKIATKNGDSKWITGEASRKYVHYQRYITDAIMAGANTVIEDNPRLTTRYAGKGGKAKKQPLRVLIDGRGRISPEATVFHEVGESLLVTSRDLSPERKAVYTDAGITMMELPLVKGYLDLKQLFRNLGDQGITSILVEGGGILMGSLFDQGLVDKVIGFVAPVIIGGQDARSPVAGNGVESMVSAMRLERVSIEKFGNDVMMSGYVHTDIM